MKSHSINNLDNFIGGWYLEDPAVCDEIIAFHKASANKHEGRIGDGVNKQIKDSVDVYLEKEILAKYCNALVKVVDKYVEKYSFCNYYSPWGITERIQIQHYKPAAGYHAWHTERTGVIAPASHRHLVFLTYLNDISDAGETEFFYQKLKVKPEKGLTLVWGTDWMFTHRGIPSPSQDKYIITGWFNFTNT